MSLQVADPARTLQYWRQGPERAAPRVLLIHGIGASSHIWHLVAQELPDLDLVAVDMLPADAGTPTSLAESVRRLLDTLSWREAVTVVGHSFGAAVAVELALEEPQRVGGLMLINGVPTLPLLARLSLKAPGVRGLLALPGAAPSLRNPMLTRLYLQAIFGDRRGVTRSVLEGYQQVADAPGFYEGMADALRAFAGHRRRLPDLRHITVPVSVAWGLRDPIFGVHLAERLVQHFPDAALHRLSRCGHCPPQQSPVVVAALIRDLVGRAARRSPGGDSRGSVGIHLD